ncbi:MAG: sensor histidine kinase [Cytophagales bacterium]|nr:MAG: sensor histidine kinase [Cytophagales bacterium]
MLKKNNLKYYIALMTFALVGLIVLQYHWLQKAHQNNQEKFKYNVQMALNNIANSLPFAEANYYVTLAKKDSNILEEPKDLLVNIPNTPIVVPTNHTTPQKIVSNNEIKQQTQSKFDEKLAFQDVNQKEYERRLKNFETDFQNQINNYFDNQFQNQFDNNFDNQFQNQVVNLGHLKNLNHLINKENKVFERNLQSLSTFTEKLNGFSHSSKFLLQLDSLEMQNLGVDIQNIDNQMYINISSQNLQQISPQNIQSIVITSNKSLKNKAPKREKVLIVPIPKEKYVSEKDASCQPITQAEVLKTSSYPIQKPTIQVKEKKDIFKLALKFEETDERKKNIEKRLQNIALEKRIKKELKQRGIHLKYNFVVASKKRNQNKVTAFYFEKNKNKNPQILKDGFEVELFPSEQSHQQHFLYLQFPQLTDYFLENMWESLFTSLLFIALIIFCFAKAISTILKQKKIAEITNDFINNMTHELKTPIATVSLACEALQDKTIQAMPKQQERYLTMIDEENKRLGSQVERVLQIAKLDKGDVQLNIETVDIHTIIDDAMEKIALQVENRGGKIMTDFGAKDSYIKADEIHLTNMILNLLDNANKYSPENPEITVKTENTKNGVKISVIDKGQGMSKEQQSKVFEKFYRVSTGNVHNVKGFGLGLSYVKMMANAQQGTIYLKSEQGKGSIFSLEFQNEKV